MSLEKYYSTCGTPKCIPRRILKARKLRTAKAIRTPIRAAVVEQAEECCERCGVFCGQDGHAHHKVPRSLGGLWTLENIEYLCWKCHRVEHNT